MANQNQTVALAEVSKAVEATIEKGKDTNTFRPYVAQLGVPTIAGYRTVKCLYKTPKGKDKAEFENSYIRVRDYITEQAVADNIAAFAPYFVAYLQEQENLIIKDMHKAGKAGVQDSELSLQVILAYLESNVTATRLNGDAIAAWFLDEMHENLAIAFAEKMGIEEEPTAAQLEKLTAILATYEAKYKSLASGKTVYRKEEAEILQKALEVTGADKTVLGQRFHARLESMKSATASDLLLAL